MEYDLATTKTFMSRVLQEYVKCGVIGTACDRAGVRRKLHDAWIENYPMYKEKYQEMKEVFIPLARAASKSVPTRNRSCGILPGGTWMSSVISMTWPKPRS